MATLMATDADLEPAFRLMDFAIEAGDTEGTFGLDWEPDSSHVQLRLLKVRGWGWGRGTCGYTHVNAQVCPGPNSDPDPIGSRTSAMRQLPVTGWWWWSGAWQNWWGQAQALEPQPQ